jgi:hypothetical protein
LDTYEGLTTKVKKDYDDDDENSSDEENGALLEEHVCLASTMMGDKHWTTNLTMLLHLDRRISAMSQQMLTTQELPGMDEIAEAIDSLQRISRFVENLNLDLDPGFVIGDVTIGISRLLVSLGDRKSQIYGAEWVGKIDCYVRTFCSDSLHKVVEALSVAWKQHDRDRDSNADDGQTKKKARVT